MIVNTTISREKKIQKQSLLCNMLMQKLYEDCMSDSQGCSEKGYIHNYTRMQNDITKLRHELNDLSKLLNNTW